MSILSQSKPNLSAQAFDLIQSLSQIKSMINNQKIPAYRLKLDLHIDKEIRENLPPPNYQKTAQYMSSSPIQEIPTCEDEDSPLRSNRKIKTNSNNKSYSNNKSQESIQDVYSNLQYMNPKKLLSLQSMKEVKETGIKYHTHEMQALKKQLEKWEFEYLDQAVEDQYGQSSAREKYSVHVQKESSKQSVQKQNNSVQWSACSQKQSFHKKKSESMHKIQPSPTQKIKQVEITLKKKKLFYKI